MFRLAGKTLKSDLMRKVRSWEICFLIIVVLSTIVYAYEEDMSSLFCFTYLYMFSMKSFLPSCNRMYHVIPTTASDRKKMMIYRSLIVELAILGYGIVSSGVISIISGFNVGLKAFSFVAFFMALYITFSTIQFAGYTKEKSTREIGFAVLFDIMAFIGFVVSEAVNYNSGEWVIGIVLVIVCTAVLLAVEVYYIYRSSFKTYKYYDVYVNERSRKKFEEQEWV